MVRRLRGAGGERGGEPAAAKDVRGLRPQGAELRAADRGAEAVVRRLRDGGGEWSGAPAAADEVRGLRPQAAELRAAGRAADAVVLWLRCGGGEWGGVHMQQQKMCEGCGLKHRVFGLLDAERKRRWCRGCSPAHRGAVNLSRHPRPAQPRAARPPKKRRREALAQGKPAPAAKATPPAVRAATQPPVAPPVATARNTWPAPTLFEVERIRQCQKAAGGRGGAAGWNTILVSWVGFLKEDDSWALESLARAAVASCRRRAHPGQRTCSGHRRRPRGRMRRTPPPSIPRTFRTCKRARRPCLLKACPVRMPRASSRTQAAAKSALANLMSADLLRSACSAPPVTGAKLRSGKPGPGASQRRLASQSDHVSG